MAKKQKAEVAVEEPVLAAPPKQKEEPKKKILGNIKIDNIIY